MKQHACKFAICMTDEKNLAKYDVLLMMNEQLYYYVFYRSSVPNIFEIFWPLVS
jgi:hypothetical protein